MPADDNLSDLDLYEEARLANSTDYVIIPELIRADECMKWEVPRDSDWIVKDDDAQRRMALDQCWVCGDAAHHANDCGLRGGRIAVTGPNAREVVEQATQQQPYFVEDLPQAEEDQAEHEKLHWVDCNRTTYCQYHAEESARTRYDEDSGCHMHLKATACRVPNCHVHEPEKQEAMHEKLLWSKCKRDFCIYHADAKEQCRIDENDPGHEHLWADDCPILDCHIHAREHAEAHERLTWINCAEKCRFHRNQRIEAREESNYLHNLIPTKECRTTGCKYHGTTKGQAQVPNTLEEMIPHMNIHWTFCTNDDCMTHFDAKANQGYFPKAGKKLGRTTQDLGRPRKEEESVVSHRHLHWSLCHRDACLVHIEAKRQADYFLSPLKKSSKKGRSSKN